MTLVRECQFATLLLTSFSLTAVVDQTRHKKGRGASPCHWFYIIICGRFESK